MSFEARSEPMVTPTDADLLKAATMLKAALDAIDRVHWQRVFINDYPRGACGHCAELLAFYLNRRFGVVPDYVCRVFYGDDGERVTSHAWLELNGLTLDISGDQFGWAGVIVTRDAPLHGRGQDEERYRWRFDPTWWAQQCGGIWRGFRGIHHR